MTALEIVIRRAGEADRTLPLAVGRATVGRADSNDIVLPDIGVSRRHLSLITNADGTVVAQDLGSGNGTWLRGKRLEGATPIRMGEILLLDPFTIEIRQAANQAPRYTPRSEQAKASAGARLDVLRGPNLAQGSYLVPIHGLSMGRSEYRDVVVLDPAASRHHCDVVQEGEDWWLKDRGSSNGVHLNDKRVIEGKLEHGDIIRIGNTELRFVMLSDLDQAQADGTNELSLPAPTALFADSATPESAQLRATVQGDTLDPIQGQELITQERMAWRRPAPWLAAASSMAAVALAGVAIASLSLAAAFALAPPRPAIELLPPRPELPPAWTLQAQTAPPTGSIEALFEQGVGAMRQDRPKRALRAFRAILVADPGNRAAERWSFTAGEHLMLDHMQPLLQAAQSERQEREAERDALLAQLPRRDAERKLKQAHRDDPVVLTRMGWMPSQVEGELSRELDRAFSTANAGDQAGARQIFESVAKRTRNPALEQRADFGRTAARRALAAQAATDWRLGVEAELRADLSEARSAYRRVLAVDRDNPSARVRLGYLGTGPEESAEVRP